MDELYLDILNVYMCIIHVYIVDIGGTYILARFHWTISVRYIKHMIRYINYIDISDISTCIRIMIILVRFMTYLAGFMRCIDEK